MNAHTRVRLLALSLHGRRVAYLASYQTGKNVYEYIGDGLANAQQFARWLLANILLGNSDAHLKLESAVSGSHHL